MSASCRSSECEVLDTWHTTGLRGSGSNDVATADVFVPDRAQRSFSLPRDPQHAACTSWPMMFAYKSAAVTLGIGRGVINTFTEIARANRLRHFRLAHRAPGNYCADDESTCNPLIAPAEGSGRCRAQSIFSSAGAIWRTLVAGHRPALKQRALYRLAVAQCHIRHCLAAVERIYKALAERRFTRRRRSIGRCAILYDQPAHDEFAEVAGDGRSDSPWTRSARPAALIDGAGRAHTSERRARWRDRAS